MAEAPIQTLEMVRAIRDDLHRETERLSRQQVVDFYAREAASLRNELRMAKGAETIAGLSRREVEIVRLLATGLAPGAIASSMNLAERTVKGHLARIGEKLGARGNAQVLKRAATLGFV